MYDEALNADSVARREFAKLITTNSIKTIIETGTFHGVTTDYLASLCDKVHTIDIDIRYQDKARPLIGNNPHITMHLGNSPKVLTELLPTIEQPAFFFLDAHWGEYCPLLDEMKAMAKQGIVNPIIAIHDFQVPGTTLGFDSHKGQPFSLEYVEPELPPLYPNGYTTYYNDDTAEGARRGILYVTPVT